MYVTTLTPDEVDYVIYHGHCTDGFMSVVCAFQYFAQRKGCNKYGTQVLYYAAYHNTLPPDLTGRKVLFCDFTYSLPLMMQLWAQTNHALAVLDHHECAREWMEPFPSEAKHYDSIHSGAYLAWTFFFGDHHIPRIIELVEDYDTYRLAFKEESVPTNLFLYSEPFSVDRYQAMFDPLYLHSIVIPEGRGMVRAAKKTVESYVKQVEYLFVRMPNNPEELYIVAHCNAPTLQNETASKLFEGSLVPDFAALFTHQPNNEYHAKLRSTEPTRANTHLIAARFHGGGHYGASAMSVFQTTTFPADIVDRGSVFSFLHTAIYTVLEENIVIVSNPKSMLAESLVQTMMLYLLETEPQPLRRLAPLTVPCVAVVVETTKVNQYIRWRHSTVECPVTGAKRLERNRCVVHHVEHGLLAEQLHKHCF